jgi:hypothetical protein
MYKAVHCVALSDWTACKTSLRQLPYVELVLESDCSSVVEYDVIDRIILKDAEYNEIRLQLIQGSLLRTEDFELYCSDLASVAHSVCSDYDISSIGCGSVRSEKEQDESTTTSEANIDFFHIINVSESVNNFSCPLKDFLLSTPGIEHAKETRVSQCNCNEVAPAPVQSEAECVYTITDASSIECTAFDIDVRRDWRVIDYVLEQSYESSFVTALSLADQVTAPRNWAENSKLRRIKLNAKRVCDTRDAFISKYNLSSLARSISSFDVIQERLNRNRKLLILLDDDLNVLAGPVRSLKGRSMSDLLVLIRFSNGVWYPASRRVIKMVMRTFTAHSASRHVYKKC